MPGTIEPKRAPVRPRVLSPHTGEAILLEDLVLRQLERGGTRLELVGGPGSGKTTALAHLANLPLADRLQLIDDVEHREIPSVPTGRLCVTATCFGVDPLATRCTLVSWGSDDLIEYLLGQHPEHCASVVDRFQHDPDRRFLQGNPQLISLVADRMASHEDWDVKRSLTDILESLVPNDHVRRQAQLYAMGSLLDGPKGWTDISRLHEHRDLIRLMAHRSVQIRFATDHIVGALSRGVFPDIRFPADLVASVASRAKEVPGTVLLLRQQLSGRRHRNPAMAGSILHLAEDGWRPDQTAARDLSGGYFANADWHRIDIARIQLRRADLCKINLKHANLERAVLGRAQLQDGQLDHVVLAGAAAPHADFSRASLVHAELKKGHFKGSDFSDANLYEVHAPGSNFEQSVFTASCLRKGVFEDCDFRSARFEETDFAGANLQRSKLTGTDLRTANLDEADLSEAVLRHSNLEDVRAANVSFTRADMRNALLSNSFFPYVEMRRTRLNGAGLAQVDWEGADLRGADFRNCSFHLGSTRCGLVGSPYPSHGTRTGFYTDDFDDHAFKPPELYRKANLRGANLCDARVFETDFYLVDLRDAVYDRDQYEHFKRCDAILSE